jgi:hypothetical protein
MNCGQSRKLFGAYWDDELTQAEREHLEAHFSSCVSCRGEYETFARALELVGSLPRVEVSPGLAERALARARRAAPVPDRVAAGGTPRWVAVTAMAALLAIAGTMVAQWAGIGLAPRHVARLDRERVPEPVLVAPELAVGPERGSPAARPGGGLEAAAQIPDSLFDPSADIEFILDPVTLRKGRAHPQPRLAPEVEGAQAVITF